MQDPIESLAIIVPVSLLFFFPWLFFFHRYTGLTRDKAYLALLASIIAGAIESFQRARELTPLIRTGGEYLASNLVEIMLRIVAAGLVYPLLTTLILRLWGRWIGGKATAEERLPGIAGIHAWFSTSNVTIGLLLVVCAWLGHDVSPLLSSVTIGGLLAAQPLLAIGATDSTPASTQGPGLASVPRPPAEDLSVEREKIVAMLEAGKLTPEESAELLQALGESSRRSTPAPLPLTSHQRLMLIGAAVVALGFFLPWFTFNPGKEATRLMGQMKFNMHIPNGGNFSVDGSAPGNGQQLNTSGLELNTGTLSYSGGDIQRGLGWATLALALAAALLPYVATTLDDRTARTIRLLCLGLGAFIVLYLLTQNIRFVGIGLIIAIAGYALEIAGALRERRAVTA